ncbi:unnamed protein product [Ostreobium quekettii]|uniref:Uncharacterized protein n=1 Tax=Ostreobium quekettii TaxID=121088 RepID=A0A8S1JB90_9CHLO|nr:unnamed protein product [Ostreobium quekettii]
MAGSRWHRRWAALLVVLQLAAGAMARRRNLPEGHGVEETRLDDKARIITWLNSLGRIGRHKVFISSEPGEAPLGYYEGITLSSIPRISDPRISAGNAPTIHFIFNVLPAWKGKNFYGGQTLENVVANKSRWPAYNDLTGSFEARHGFADTWPSWVVAYSDASPFHFVTEELRTVSPGLLLGRSYLLPAVAGDEPFFEYALLNTDLLAKGIEVPSGLKGRVEKAADVLGAKEDKEPTKAPRPPRKRLDKKQAPPRYGPAPKIPSFSSPSELQEWIAGLSAGARTRLFASTEPGPMPLGAYYGTMVGASGLSFDTFNVSFRNAATFRSLAPDWRGKHFLGNGKVQNIVRSGTAFRSKHLRGSVALGQSLVDGKQSWILRNSIVSVSYFLMDEMREIQPGFLLGKTFLSDASPGDKPLFDCTLVKVADGVPKGKTASDIIEAAVKDEFASAIAVEPEASPPSTQKGDTGVKASKHHTHPAPGGQDETGAKLAVPEFSDAVSFKTWLSNLDESERKQAFEATSMGSRPRGVYSVFIVSDVPRLEDFNILSQDRAIVQFFMQQLVGRIFDRTGSSHSVLRNDAAFDPDMLVGEVKIGEGFADSADSWIVRSSNESLTAVMVDELREIEPGFFYGRTFPRPVGFGDKPLFECGLVKVADKVPKGLTASAFLDAAV